MPDVVCSERSLARDRPNGITRRLKVISDAPLYIERKPTSGAFSLIARSGQRITNDEQWYTFPSRIDTVTCQYGEHWKSIRPDDRDFQLHSVYLHLLSYRGRESEPKEIIAFHWHSVDDGDGYSNLPHMHVKASRDPLPRSHFGLTLTVNATKQGTVEYLDSLLDAAVNMVEAEVLQRIDSTPLRWT